MDKTVRVNANEALKLESGNNPAFNLAKLRRKHRAWYVAQIWYERTLVWPLRDVKDRP